MAILLSIIPIIWIIFMVYWFVSALSSKRTIRSGGWWYWALIRLALFVVVILVLDSNVKGSLAYLTRPSSDLTSIIIGTLFVALGVGTAIWARAYLGKNWGMPMSTKEDPELVTSGPYRFVRHPIYSGVLLAALGAGLADGKIWLMFFVFFCFYFIYSATQEEKIMAREFPAQYAEYKKRTKMLVPFIF